MTSTLTRSSFTVGARQFAAAVAWAADHTQSRPSVPAHGCLLLKVSDGTLTVSGYDEAAAGTATLDVEGGDGQWLVSARLLNGLADTFPDKPLTVAEADNRLAVQCGTSKFTLPLGEIADYPTLPTMPTRLGEVDAETFARAVKRVVFAVSDQPGLPQLCGVGVRTIGDHLELAACDRHRLATVQVKWTPASPNVEADLLVSPATLRSINRLAATHGSLTISAASALVGLSGGAFAAVGGLLAQKFPWVAVQHAHALASETPARVLTADLLDALRRAKLLFTDKAEAVRLAFDTDALHVLSGTDAAGDDGVPCTYAGPARLVGFNVQYLHDALVACGTAEVDIVFTEGNLATRFDPVGDESYVHVVQAIDLSRQPKVVAS